MDYANDIVVFINGKKDHLINPDPTMTLLTYLRGKGITGTKLGCGEGGCGACTVLMSWYDWTQKSIHHCAINACLARISTLDGCAITTVEGIGGLRQGLHPIQKRLAEFHGSQCGFCTPGIVMAIYAQMRSNPNSTPHEIESALDGNLCRCTGYRPIIDGARSLSNNKIGGGCCGGSESGGCPCQESKTTADTAKSIHNSSEKTLSDCKSLEEEMKEQNFTEPIFPPALMSYSPRRVRLETPQVKLYQPLTVEELLTLKKKYNNAKLVNGNTEVGIEVKFKAMEYSVLINPTRILELQTIERVVHDNLGEGIAVGSLTTINALRSYVQALQLQLSDPKLAYPIRSLGAIKDMLTWFASNQIRNVATVAGNIVTASPISDLNPMLMACGATFTIKSLDGTREVPADKFFISYRKVDLAADEILYSVFIPFSKEFEFVLPFKQARRREDDISIVTSGMRFNLEPSPARSNWIIKDCAIAYGGMAPTTIAVKAAKTLIGRPWSNKTFEDTLAILRNEIQLPPNVPGGQAEYRMSLAVSFLFKAFLLVNTQLATYISDIDMANAPEVIPNSARESSGAKSFVIEEKAYTRGEQNYIIENARDIHVARPVTHTIIPASTGAEETKMSASLGQPIQHKNAYVQVTGETKYTNDMPPAPGMVYACLVTSTRAHAKLKYIDVSEAESCDGFVAFYSAKDVTGNNHIGAVVKDEEVFATEYVKYFGAVIGVVVADTHEHAVYAARKVKIDYEDVLPIAVSIEDAIKHNSYYSDHHELRSGDIEVARESAEIHVTGERKIGAQEHFYLETNCTIVIPSENGELEIYSSTQNPTKTQNFCASVCGISASKVVSKCKRMGGGFGGKETRSVFIACTAALASYLLNRPVSINIERDVDMSISGQRHSFIGKYSAGCTKDGIIKYVQYQLYSNAGYSLDLSQPVMDRALFHCDNVYEFPALHCRGSICKTNQPSHTAFRGFGGPQGLIMAEMVMDHLASATGIPVDILRRRNMYKEGSITHFGMPLEDFNVPMMWDQLYNTANIAQRRNEVEKFNAENRWRKRGISIVPTKFGISFTAKFMNQGGALVHVYTDGSVLVAHGGTEMGQGLHTKIIQIVAHCFNIPHSYVQITETATNTVANSSPTAASMSTDLYGMAVLDACEQILERLKPIKQRLPEADWKAVVSTAFFERINLSAQGFYVVKSERCGYDWSLPVTDNAKRGTPFNYFTFGVACSEVEIDCLTGDSHIIRTDILMDVGQSINPALDIGQIEGAFIQGYGWCTMEEMVWGDSDHPWVRPGQLFTRGPGTYKIPAFNDVPRDFRVHLSNFTNKFAIHSSKAVGEPPFFLGSSVFFAIQEAVRSARKENGLDTYFAMNCPATSERIRMACGDTIAGLCIDSKAENSSGINSDRVEVFQPKGSW